MGLLHGTICCRKTPVQLVRLAFSHTYGGVLWDAASVGICLTAVHDSTQDQTQTSVHRVRVCLCVISLLPSYPLFPTLVLAPLNSWSVPSVSNMVYGEEGRGWVCQCVCVCVRVQVCQRVGDRGRRNMKKELGFLTIISISLSISHSSWEPLGTGTGLNRPVFKALLHNSLASHLTLHISVSSSIKCKLKMAIAMPLGKIGWGPCRVPDTFISLHMVFNKLLPSFPKLCIFSDYRNKNCIAVRQYRKV